MTKNDRYVVERLNRYYGRTLADCYSKPSQSKLSAYETIWREMVACGGSGLTVLSYNTHMFTCAYFAEDDDGNLYVVHHTPSKKSIIWL